MAPSRVAVTYNLKTCIPGRVIVVAIASMILNACVYGVPIVSPVDALAVMGAADAFISDGDEGEPIETRITGTYENGFWLDRSLYYVHVEADSVEEAKRVAYLTATDSCQKRQKSLKIIESIDTDSAKYSDNYFTRYGAANSPPMCEIRFRCESEESPDSGSGKSP